MHIQILEQARVICSNRNSLHNYFAWPSVARLPGGALAMVASGLRVKHVDPFGKGILCYSFNEGRTWTAPAVILDTPLDDRDCGIVAFGDNVMVSRDAGSTWSEPVSLHDNQGISLDLGYPASVELDDGSILTVFYAHPEPGAPAEILQVVWKIA